MPFPTPNPWALLMWVRYPPQGASRVVQRVEFVLTTTEDTAKSPEDRALGRVTWQSMSAIAASQTQHTGPSPAAQGPRLSTSAGGLGSISGQGTRSHMPQLKVCTPQRKIPRATTTTRCRQINKCFVLFLNTIHNIRIFLTVF